MADLIIKPSSSNDSLKFQGSDDSAQFTIAGTTGSLGSGIAFPSGHVIKTSSYDMGRGTYGASAFPMDDTIPQITEGVEIWSQSYTPTSNATNILIRVSGLFIIETSNIADGVVSALFISGTNDAQFVMLGQKVDGGSSLHHGSCNGEILVSSWSGAKTISVRKGSAHHAVNYWLGSGHTTGTTMFGASVKATVTVQEIA